MKTQHVYICEDSVAGIFTGIYDAWASKYGHAYNRLEVKEPDNLEFFSEFIYVQSDYHKAEKVIKAIRSKISEEAYIKIYNCTLSKRTDKAEHIYRFLILGFSMGVQVLEYLVNPHVDAVLKMDLNVKQEFFNYEGFLRFTSLETGVLVAKFRPENHIITVLADFFTDRMPDENWIIYDEGRKLAAIHKYRKKWFLYQDLQIEIDLYSQDKYLELWKHFVNNISIEERYNEKLQLQMMPYRYREFMPENEFKQNEKGSNR